MDFMELAKSRYSCRKLSDREVAPELIDRIIDAGLAAPTAVNKQPVRIWHMASEEARQIIREITTCTFGAEHFLVVGCRPEEAWVRPFDGKNFAQVDAAIVATHMLLEIQQLGLATTWVGYFDAPALQQRCPAMKGWDLVAIFPVGYAASDAQPSDRHAVRKTREEFSETL